MANLFATATIAHKVTKAKAEVTMPGLQQYVPIGYINEMDEPVICNMTAQKLQYCNLSGFTILFKKV